MKRMAIFAVSAFLLAAGGVWARAEDAPAAEKDKALAASMLSRIDAYHNGAPRNGRVLHIIYFHPADVEPQALFRERLTRIMLDIQDFYRSEMKRHGFGERVFPLDMADGQLRIRVVKGKDPASAYSYESGGKVRGEIQRALAGALQLDREYVLIFNGMCRKVAENDYFFHAPYYGDSSSDYRHGLCHVADCEKMDPALLTETKTAFRYEEHLGKFRRTLAEFNSLYIGGVAHELGHGLGLPHDHEQPWEKSLLGTALMGAGNFTYRREKWGGKGSFLTTASGLRLAAHPLFTGSDRGRDERVQCTLTDLGFSAEAKELLISGKVQTSVPASGVIAYSDPEGGGDYDALTWVSDVRDGTFAFRVGGHRPSAYELRLAVCHVNGAVSTFKFPYRADRDGRPDAETLNAAGLVREPVRRRS